MSAARRARRAATALVLLAGCAGAVAPPASREGARFLPDAGGLGVAGSALRIDFGRSPEGVIAALERELGKGRALGLEGCPPGIVAQRDWNGLVLSFTEERFVGWRGAAGHAGQTCGALA